VDRETDSPAQSHCAGNQADRSENVTVSQTEYFNVVYTPLQDFLTCQLQPTPFPMPLRVTHAGKR